MSAERKYLSGAAKRKLSKQRKETELAEQKKQKKLTTFLVQQLAEDEVTGEDMDQEKNLPETVEETLDKTSSDESEELQFVEDEPLADVDRSKEDPANWSSSISDSDRTELVKCGPVRVTGFDFPLDEDRRRFTEENYFRKMSNGEMIDRSWLVYSKQKDAVFCFACKLFGGIQSHLTDDGFNNWRSMSTHLRDHEVSQNHRDTMQKWKLLHSGLKAKSTIDIKNQNVIEKERIHWQKVLERLLSIVQHLAERNLAFRGDVDRLDEANNGNFFGQVELLAKFDAVLAEHVRRIRQKEIFDHYLGKRIQNELILLMAKEVSQNIKSLVKQCKYFSIMLDCTPDISRIEQMSIIVRIVDCASKPFRIREHFLGFICVDDTTGEDLTDKILDFLKQNALDVNDCRGQGYDNGSNMKGKHSGVQARILGMNNCAFYLPCGNHSLNLLICDAASSSRTAVSFFGLLQRLYVFCSASTLRWEVLKKHCNLTLKPLSETRWECRVDSTKVVRFQLAEVHETLLEIAETAKDSATMSEAQSLADEIVSYPFILSLVVWHDILVELNKVTKLLQNPHLNIVVANNLINVTKTLLEMLRTSGFEKSIEEANVIAERLAVPAVFPVKRQARKKRQFTYEGHDEPIEDEKERFKVEFFYRLIDVTLSKMEERFTMLKDYNAKFGFLHNFELLRNSEGGQLSLFCAELQSTLTDKISTESDIDGEKMARELRSFILLLPVDVTFPSDVLQHIFSNELSEIYPNVTIAIRILLTTPVSVASAERSFSKLKLVKTYLRSTMSQERLSGLSVIAIEKEISRNVDYSKMIKVFASSKVRRIRFV